jgi:hypothetical protein
MSWFIIGYLAKQRVTRSGWTNEHGISFPVPSPVEQICSVSNCIVRTPERSDTPCNGFGVYDIPELAWEMLPSEMRGDFELYAYALYFKYFEDGLSKEVDFSGVDPTELPNNFQRLGYDAVELRYGFGCSPLSCNGQTCDVNVNQFCLVETEREAIELARTFSVSKPEPGPYCAIEVWRESNTKKES